MLFLSAKSRYAHETNFFCLPNFFLKFLNFFSSRDKHRTLVPELINILVKTEPILPEPPVIIANLILFSVNFFIVEFLSIKYLIDV
jgi:hypothetical protein